MKTITSIGAMWLIVIASQADGSIAAGPFTNSINGHYYFLLNPATWSSLEAEAVALGGHLATVRNPAEQEWLVSTFSSFIGAQSAFIGLTDRDTEGVWMWVSGDFS